MEEKEDECDGKIKTMELKFKERGTPDKEEDGYAMCEVLDLEGDEGAATKEGGEDAWFDRHSVE